MFGNGFRIADARCAISQLDDVARARPEVTHAVESMISKGKWTVPGYTESEFLAASYESGKGRQLTPCPLRRVRSAYRVSPLTPPKADPSFFPLALFRT